jgi:hypothetical protein
MLITTAYAHTLIYKQFYGQADVYKHSTLTPTDTAMRSDIKFIRREPGGMPYYESTNPRDMQLTHASHEALVAGLRRPGMRILTIMQQLVLIGPGNYHLIQENRRIAVLYAPVVRGPRRIGG